MAQHAQKIQEILLAGLHRDASHFEAVNWSAVGEEDWRTLIALASRHGVASLLYQRLKAPGVAERLPDDVLRQWRDLYHQTAANNLRLYYELRVLLLALRAAEIPVLVLKGAYLAMNVYRNIALRPMCDIDVLVPRTAARQALKVLQEAGYTLLIPATEESIPWVGKDMVLRKAGHVFNVEVHWTISDHEVDVNLDEAWARSQTTRLQGVETGVFATEDFLLHLCLHAAYHHAFNVSLRPLCDIAVFVDHFQAELSWERFCQYTARYGWGKGVYLILWLAKARVGAKVPDEVLARLKPADLPEAVVAAAEYRLFNGRDTASALSPKFVTLWGGTTMLAKLRGIGPSIFLPREVMARLYPLPPDSPWLYGYYLIRCKDLLVHYRRAIWRLLRGDPEFNATVRQRDALQDWLTRSDAPA